MSGFSQPETHNQNEKNAPVNHQPRLPITVIYSNHQIAILAEEERKINWLAGGETQELSIWTLVLPLPKNIFLKNYPQ